MWASRTSIFLCIHWILSWVLNTSKVLNSVFSSSVLFVVTIQFGIHLQKNRGIYYSIQYSLIKILWYSVFNSVFTICNFKVFSIQLSIQQAEVLSTQYSTQCSNQFSVFTKYSTHDGIWSIQYSMYSVFTYSLVNLLLTPEIFGLFSGWWRFPTFWFFKYLDNNTVYSLGIGVYLCKRNPCRTKVLCV